MCAVQTWWWREAVDVTTAELLWSNADRSFALAQGVSDRLSAAACRVRARVLVVADPCLGARELEQGSGYPVQMDRVALQAVIPVSRSSRQSARCLSCATVIPLVRSISLWPDDGGAFRSRYVWWSGRGPRRRQQSLDDHDASHDSRLS